MDQLVILLIFAAFAGLKWLVENAHRFKKQEPPSTQTEQQEEAPLRRQPLPERGDSEEEKMRRFMEALGLPTDGSAAPPPARRAPAPPPVAPVAPAPPPPVEPEVIVKERRFPQAPPPPPIPRAPEPVFRREPEPPPIVTRPVIPPPPVPTPRAQWMEPSVAVAPMEALVPEMPAPRPSAYRIEDRKALPLELQELHQRLRSVKALREAYILREILGPPKALRE